MSRKPPSSFLQEEVRLLVQHFGVDRLRAELEKVSNGAAQASSTKALPLSVKLRQNTAISITRMLEDLRKKDEKKYHFITDFYTNLKNRKILPESQDILHFAQLIGLKDVGGKSRKDMIPKLIRFLLEQSTEQLQINIKTAADVSEQQRQQGFSILTDKLLGGDK